MILDGGRLTHRIALLVATETKSPTGQKRSSFATVATVWGERLELRVVDATRAGTADAFAISRYLIRYRTGLSTKMRATIDGKTFEVRSIDEPPGDRRRALILTLEEVFG